MDTNDAELCEALRCVLGRATLHSNGVFSVGFLTVRQVAEKLCTSEAWVRRHAGELGVTRLGEEGRGADLRFSRTGIDDYLQHATPGRAGSLR